MVAPNAPSRCPIDPLVCYAIDGFIEGLQNAKFPMGILPTYFERELKVEGYEMPDQIWDAINLMNCAEQAEIIYEMIRSVHVSRALFNVRKGENPLGFLEERKHLALPVELAGATHFRKILDELIPLLPRFGLDQGSVWGKTGRVEYPSVLNLFYKRRAQFFRVHQLDTYEGMMHFLTHLPEELPDWPLILSGPFQDEETAISAIDCLGDNFH